MNSQGDGHRPQFRHRWLLVAGVIAALMAVFAWKMPDGILGFSQAKSVPAARLAPSVDALEPAVSGSSSASSIITAADLSTVLKKSMSGEVLTDQERRLIREPGTLSEDDLKEVARTREVLLRRSQTEDLSDGETGILKACCRILDDRDCMHELEH